jgi:hypothetical protein
MPQVKQRDGLIEDLFASLSALEVNKNGNLLNFCVSSHKRHRLFLLGEDGRQGHTPAGGAVGPLAEDRQEQCGHRRGGRGGTHG